MKKSMLRLITNIISAALTWLLPLCLGILMLLDTYGPWSVPFPGKITYDSIPSPNIISRYNLGFSGATISWSPKMPGVLFSLEATNIQEYKKNKQQKWRLEKEILLPKSFGIGANVFAPLMRRSIINVYLSDYHLEYEGKEDKNDTLVPQAILYMLSTRTKFDFMMLDSSADMLKNNRHTKIRVDRLSIYNSGYSLVHKKRKLYATLFDEKDRKINVDFSNTEQTGTTAVIDLEIRNFDTSLLHGILNAKLLKGVVNISSRAEVDPGKDISIEKANLSALSDKLYLHGVGGDMKLAKVNCGLSCEGGCKSLKLDGFATEINKKKIMAKGTYEIDDAKGNVSFNSDEEIDGNYIYESLEAFVKKPIINWLNNNLKTKTTRALLNFEKDKGFLLDVGLSDTTLAHDTIKIYSPTSTLLLSNDNIKVMAPKAKEVGAMIDIKNLQANIKTGSDEKKELAIEAQCFGELKNFKELAYKILKEREYPEIEIAGGRVKSDIEIKVPLEDVKKGTTFDISGELEEAKINRIKINKKGLQDGLTLNFPNAKYRINNHSINMYGEAVVSGIAINHFQYEYDIEPDKHSLLVDSDVDIASVRHLLPMGEHTGGKCNVHFALFNQGKDINYDAEINLKGAYISAPQIALDKRVEEEVKVSASGSFASDYSIQVKHYAIKSNDFIIEGKIYADSNSGNLSLIVDNAEWGNNKLSLHLIKGKKSGLRATLNAKQLDISNLIANIHHFKPHAEMPKKAEHALKQKDKNHFTDMSDAVLKIKAEKVIIKGDEGLSNLKASLKRKNGTIDKASASAFINQYEGYVTLFYAPEVTSFYTNNISKVATYLGQNPKSFGGSAEVKMLCSKKNCSGNAYLSKLKIHSSSKAASMLKLAALTSIYSAMSGSGVTISNAHCIFDYNHNGEKILNLKSCKIISPEFYSQGEGMVNISRKSARIEAMITPMTILKSATLFLATLFPSALDSILEGDKSRTNFILEKEEGAEMKFKTMPLSMLLPGRIFSKRRGDNSPSKSATK